MPIAIMRVTTSVAIMQVFLGGNNHIGGTFCNTYVGGSFCCNYAADCFCCNYAVRSFCSTYSGESFYSKYVCHNFYCNYADGSLLQLCRCYFLLWIMHMTVSIVIIQVPVSAEALYMTVSSTASYSFLWHPIFIKLTRKHLHKGIISAFHFTTS